MLQVFDLGFMLSAVLQCLPDMTKAQGVLKGDMVAPSGRAGEMLAISLVNPN